MYRKGLIWTAAVITAAGFTFTSFAGETELLTEKLETAAVQAETLKTAQLRQAETMF